MALMLILQLLTLCERPHALSLGPWLGLGTERQDLGTQTPREGGRSKGQDH